MQCLQKEKGGAEFLSMITLAIVLFTILRYKHIAYNYLLSTVFDIADLCTLTNRQGFKSSPF